MGIKRARIQSPASKRRRSVKPILEKHSRRKRNMARDLVYKKARELLNMNTIIAVEKLDKAGMFRDAG